jgi:hypothetical protein
MQLLLGLCLFAAVLHPAWTDDILDDDGAFESVTGCVLTVTGPSSSTPTNVACEFAVFSPYPVDALDVSLSSLPSPDDKNLGCESLLSSTKGTAALLSRGVCPFTSKAAVAQKAGAVAMIVGDTDEDTHPVRMKGTGHEEPTDIVTIPCVMVSLDDYTSLSTMPDGTRIELSTSINTTHPLAEERKLKAEFNYSPDSGEASMQLGAYYIRMNWKETGRHMLKHAAKVASDYEIQYSVGEYFHNVEESVEGALEYWVAAANDIVDKLVAKGGMPQAK